MSVTENAFQIRQPPTAQRRRRLVSTRAVALRACRPSWWAARAMARAETAPGIQRPPIKIALKKS